MVKPLFRGGKTMHRNTNNLRDSKVFNTAISILSGGVLTVLCLLLFSFIMTKVDAPDGLVSAMSSISLCVGSYFAGFLISKRYRKNGLFTGVFCGLIIFAITFIISMIFMKFALTMGTFSKLIMIIVCTSIGGIIGVNSKVRF